MLTHGRQQRAVRRRVEFVRRPSVPAIIKTARERAPY